MTFTNEYANPGTLEICKLAGPPPLPPPLGTSFNFTSTVNQVVTGTAVIPLGGCGFLLNADGSVQEIPFNTNVKITESGSTGNAATVISVIPTYVSEVVGSTLTLTGETAQSGTPNLGTVGTASSVNVVIGETTVTEAVFTDIDPPVVSSGSSVTVANAGGANAGTTTGATAAIASRVASKVGLHSMRAKLAADKAAIKRLSLRRALAKSASVKRALARRIAALKAAEKLLNKEIRFIK